MFLKLWGQFFPLTLLLILSKQTKRVKSPKTLLKKSWWEKATGCSCSGHNSDHTSAAFAPSTNCIGHTWTTVFSGSYEYWAEASRGGCFQWDLRDTQVFLTLIVWILHLYTFLKIRLSQRGHMIFQKVSDTIKLKSGNFFKIFRILEEECQTKCFFEETTPGVFEGS